MICTPCRLAGDVLQGKPIRGTRPGTDQQYEIEVIADLEHRAQVVQTLHDQCKGWGHCDCQHRQSGVAPQEGTTP